MRVLYSLIGTSSALVLLAWLPFFGPFIAGVICGGLSGSLFGAAGVMLTICGLAAVTTTGISFLITGIGWFSAAVGAISMALVVTHLGPLVMGAFLGVIASTLIARRRSQTS